MNSSSISGFSGSEGIDSEELTAKEIEKGFLLLAGDNLTEFRRIPVQSVNSGDRREIEVVKFTEPIFFFLNASDSVR